MHLFLLVLLTVKIRHDSNNVSNGSSSSSNNNNNGRQSNVSVTSHQAHLLQQQIRTRWRKERLKVQEKRAIFKSL